jgi:hypothetical protein
MGRIKKNKVEWEETKENPKEEKVVQYLTTWLMMYGKGFIEHDEASKVDDLISDWNEVCWSYALDKGYIYNVGWTRYHAVDMKSRLTKAGLEYINRGLQQGEQHGI